jgi:hypothetical protein
MMKSVAMAFVLALSGGLSWTNAFEAPPVSRAQDILGSQASGPNYRIDSEVRSDGLMRLYELKTSAGAFEVTGDDLIRVRIRELEALRKLNAMSESDVFVKSLGAAAAAPLRYGADLITDPSATLRRTASGVTNMFDRIGASVSNQRSNRDNVVTSILGVDAARRTLAVQLRVDPHTDFAPLASKLNDVASAAAFGGLSVKALTLAIPGGAGVAVGAVSTADTVTGLLAEKTSTQIVEIVRAELQARKIPGSVIDRLVQNRAYSPSDLLILSRSLRSLNAGNTSLFLAKAAGAPTHEEAFFQRRRAELLAKNAKKLGVGAFVDVAGFPLNRSKDGGVIALFPLDDVAWTERNARTFEAATRATDGSPSRVLAVTGRLTEMAEKEISALGWKVVKVD